MLQRSHRVSKPILKLGTRFAAWFLLIATIPTPSDAEIPVASQRNSSNALVTVFIVLREPAAAEVWQSQPATRSRLAARELVRKHLDGMKVRETALRRGLTALGARETGRLRKLANAIRVEVPSDKLEELALLPGVTRVKKARLYTRGTITSVAHAGAPPLWMNRSARADGSGIRIGIIDGGIDYTHADFGGAGTPSAFLANDGSVIEPGSFPTAKVVGGYDFVGDDYNAADPALDVPQPDPDPLDTQHGHGTGVAAIAAGFGVLTGGATYTGSYSNGLDLSTFSIGPGMAPQALLYSLKIFGRGGGTRLVADALEWAADPNNDDDFSDRLDVVNLSIVNSFGLGDDEDFETIVADNLSRLGCVVVGSAGNSGNSFYITGGTGSAPSAISTANLNDYLGAIQILSPLAAAGLYFAIPAQFSPQLSGVGANKSLVYAEPNDACAPLVNTQAIEGNIALIDRGTCLFVDKIERAAAAGAIAVIVINNVPGPPIEMSGTNQTSIPAVMISEADGRLLKDALQGSSVVAHLDASLTSPDDIHHDKVANNSSRGPVAPRHLLKPEIAAAGNGVFTAAAGTGHQGKLFSGTSSAAPHVAGAAALLRQLYPTWPAEDIKAALMNTAAAIHDTNGLPYPESRVGAGRLQVDRAAAIQVTAAADSSDGRVAVSFGALELVEPAIVTQRVRLQNHSSDSYLFTISITNTVLEDGILLSPSSDTVTVPPFGSAIVDLELSAVPELFDRTLDPGTPLFLNGRARVGIYEISGNLWFHHPSNIIHLPFHAVVRAAANQKSVGNILWPDTSEAVAVIPISGSSAHPEPLVSAFQLGYLTDTLNLNSVVDSPADLLAVGAACNAAAVGNFTNSVVFFGLVTATSWTSPHFSNVGLRVEVDSDFDGVAEAMIYNTSYANFTATNLIAGAQANDILMTAVQLSSATVIGTNLNYFAPDLRDTVLFNTRVMVEPVPVSSLGLTSAQTRFAYKVSSFGNRAIGGGLVKETPWIIFDGANPGLDTARGLDNSPFFAGGGHVTVSVLPSAFEAYPQQPAILLLHHMNVVSNQMEVIRFQPQLDIGQSGQELILDWSHPGPFKVQFATNLYPTPSWIDLATATNQFRVPTVPSGTRFFRLAHLNAPGI